MGVIRLLNSQALTALYDGVPSFVGAEVLEVVFNPGGPSLSVRFMMAGKPENPPAKWPKTYDVVYVGVSFGAVAVLGFSGWGTSNVVSMLSTCSLQDREEVCVAFENGCQLRFSYDWGRVENISYGLMGSP